MHELLKRISPLARDHAITKISFVPHEEKKGGWLTLPPRIEIKAEIDNTIPLNQRAKELKLRVISPNETSDSGPPYLEHIKAVVGASKLTPLKSQLPVDIYLGTSSIVLIHRGRAITASHSEAISRIVSQLMRRKRSDHPSLLKLPLPHGLDEVDYSGSKGK